MTKVYVSQSQLSAFDRCPRKYYYQYIMRYYGENTWNAAMDFGSTIHDIIDKASSFDSADREEMVQNMIYDKVIEVESDSKKDYESRLLKLVKPLATISVSYTILESEKYVSSKLFDEKELSASTLKMLRNFTERKGKDGSQPIEGVWFGGFLDAVTKNGNGVDVVDWKTGRFSRNWIHVYERQIQLYSHLMRLNGYDVKRALIVYVEQKGKEHEVDVTPETCQKVYDKMTSTYEHILSLGEELENFKKIDNEGECNGCYFDFICNV